MTGNCSRCGRVETLFEIESSGERICSRCITTPLRHEVAEDRLPHGLLHFTEIPGCPECIEQRRMRR